MPTTIAVSPTTGVQTPVSPKNCRDDWPKAVIPAAHYAGQSPSKRMSLWPPFACLLT
jgi:hypothetical protein